MPLPEDVKTVAQRLRAARLNSQEDRVRCHVLRRFALGLIPSVTPLAVQSQIPPADVRQILRRLAGLDLLILDPAGETVLAAYPFSSSPTAHRVLLKGRQAYALCAVDALGIPAMLQEEAGIVSRCAHCGSQVEIQASPDQVTRYLPGGAVVWFPISEDECCPVAESRCPYISFFCARDHLEAWHRGNGQPPGVVLSVHEAFEAGQEIFGALLT